MTTDLKQALIVFALPPLIVFILQAFWMRVLPRKSPQLLTMASMVLGYPIFFLILREFNFTRPLELSFYIYFFLIYSLSAYTYFHFFNMSETSRRVRMLNMISNRKISRVSDLQTIYDDGDMIDVRLTRLVALGQITERQGRFFPKGRLFVYAAMAFYGFGLILGRPWVQMNAFKKQKRLT